MPEESVVETPRPDGVVRLALILGGLVVVALVAVLFLKPAAPKVVTILVTPEGTSEHELGRIYAQHLEKAGLEATLLELGTSNEGLARLPQIDGAVVSFLISGGERELADPSVADGFVSLGSIGLEPLWFFARIDAAISSMGDLGDARVVLGPPGSRTSSIGRLVLTELGLESTVLETSSLPEAVDALTAGRAEAGLMVSGVNSEIVEELMEAEGVRPVSLGLADAFVARVSWLSVVTYPRGAFDLQRILPPEDLRLVAGSTNLVVREDSHPALVDLLLDIAREVNGDAGPFWRRGTFPNAEGVSLRLDPAARRFYDQGPSKWRRLLPYRLATMVDRLTGVIVPALTTFLVLFQLIPGFLRLRLNISLKKLYMRLEKLEKRAAEPDVDTAELLRPGGFHRCGFRRPLGTSLADLRVPRAQAVHSRHARTAEPARRIARAPARSIKSSGSVGRVVGPGLRTNEELDPPLHQPLRLRAGLLRKRSALPGVVGDEETGPHLQIRSFEAELSEGLPDPGEPLSNDPVHTRTFSMDVMEYHWSMANNVIYE